MAKLEIKAKKLAQRCEVCHQSDCYYPKYDICSRCYKASFGKMVFLKIKQEFQNLDRTMSLYTIKGALFLVILFNLMGLIFGLCLLLIGHNPIYCSCYDSSNSYDIKKIPIVLFPLTMSFPIGNFFGLVYWLIGLSIKKLKLSVFKELVILLTSGFIGYLSLAILGVLAGCSCGDGYSVPEGVLRCSIGGLILGLAIWFVSFFSRKILKLLFY